MNLKGRQLLLFLFLSLYLYWWPLQTSFAQESEEDLSKYALEMFENEEYAAASKTYSTLLSIKLQSPEYNFRFGACQLFTIQDKEEPLKYLKFAAEQSSAPALSFFYYGLGLHLNYQFDQAIKQYERYKTSANKKDKEFALVDQYINQCIQGKKLISNFTDINVVQRTVLPRTEFYRNYDLSSFGGKIIVKPEDFMSEEDKKRNAKMLMYFQQDAELIYYASHSEKNLTGKDLYVIQKLPGGNWSTPKRLDNTINTSFDEDFPFIHPDGNVLYFASKGHNSMGGYDIFKSERRGDGTWTSPINMEFAINTPWDDFMFITDLEESMAWFASNRATSNTEVNVYKIGIERIPLDLTLIKGVFNTEGSKKATITVDDMVQGKTVGVFYADGQTGEYLMDLRGSGQYKFLVEAEESNAIHSGIVEIPREKGLKQFRQEMNLNKNGGKEQLQIINHFDEPLDEQLLTADILRKQASLNVNASESDIKSTLTVIDAGTSNTSKDNDTALDKEAMISRSKTAIKELETEAADLNKKASALYEVAQKNYNTEDPTQLAKAAIAIELASSFKSEANLKLNSVDQMNALLVEMESNSAEPDAIKAKYTELAAARTNFISNEKFESRTLNDFQKRVTPATTAYESTLKEVNKLEADISAIDEEIAYYQKEIETTKDAAVKEELSVQIEEAKKARPVKQISLDKRKAELSSLSVVKENAEDYLLLASELVASATEQSKAITENVSNVALNEMLHVMEKKAEEDPALLAILIPDKGESVIKSMQLENKSKAVDQGDVATNDLSLTNEKSEQSKSAPTDGDINQTIQRITNSPSETQKINGDLDAYFNGQLASTESKESDPLVLESNKAEIYDQWAANLQLKIDSIESVKAVTTDYILLNELDEDLNSLKSAQLEKQNLAQQSYERVAALSDVAAENEPVQTNLSSNTTTSENPDEVITSASNNNQNTVPVTPALLEEGKLPPTVEKLNKQYEQELIAINELAATTDPLNYQQNRAKALESWANDLQKEMDILAQQIQVTQDITQKRILEKKASEVGEIRLEKLREANNIKLAINEAKDAEQIKLANQDLQNQLSNYVENYNASAFEQIETQINSIPNEDQRAAQLEVLYKNWRVGILNEKVKTEARLANATDQNRIPEFENKIIALERKNARVQYVLDSLNAEQNDFAGPQAPSSIRVQGSEKFEGYVPVDAAEVTRYETEKQSNQSADEDIKDEIAALSTSLETTKKKQEREEIQATIRTREIEQKNLAMRSKFYEEAALKIAAVESQLLTMSPGEKLPSENQRIAAEALKNNAIQATANAQLAMDQALSIKKRKEREPAVVKATVIQAEAGILRERADLELTLANDMAQIEKEAINKNFIVLPVNEVILPATRRTLNPNEQADIAKTDEFQRYASRINEADSILRIAKNLDQQEAQLNQQAQALMLQATTAPLTSNNGTDKIALTERAYKQFEKADSLSKASAILKRQSTFYRNEANRSLLTLPEEAYMNVIAYYNSDIKKSISSEPSEEPNSASETPKTTETAEVNTTARRDEFALDAPRESRTNSSIEVNRDVLTNTIFDLDQNGNKASYNNQNPIPIDPPLPSGLMYKVQIGAFRNPIQQDIFKGISPIIGERNNAGFTRYSAGEFNNLSSAENAKGRIQSLGYRDAFVVAYYNGKRITIAQAQALERGENIAIANNGNVTPNPNNPRSNQNQFIKQGPIEISAVENTRGAFYTIQVGVFSKPVTSAEIFNITPLQQENLTNGLFRYTTGKFNNLNDAETAKNEARALGIADAFITAYRDGQRVTVASVGAVAPQETPVSAPKYYTILLGTYTDKVPVAVASKILSLSSEGIEKKENADGSKSYYYGSFSNKAQAESVVSKLLSEGITTASAVEQP